MGKKTIQTVFLTAGLLILAGLAGTAPGWAGAWAAPQDQPAATVIAHVRIFDGENLIPADTVIFKNGRIEAVGKSLLPPPGAAVIDGRG